MPRARKWKRRPRGSGSVHLRRDGLWCSQPPKALAIRPRYFRTKTQAEAWLSSQLARPDSQPSTPLGTYLDAWYRRAAPLLDSPASRTAYDAALTRLEPLRTIPLAELRPSHVEAWAGELLKRVSLGTVSMTRATLATALESGVRDGILDRNAAKLARLPKAAPKESKAYTIEEAGRILTALAGHRLEAFFVLALYHGLRMGELRGLQWRDVDWVAGSLTITRQVEEGKSTVRDVTKGKRSRVVKLAARPLAVLTALRDRIGAGSVWLFPSPRDASVPVSTPGVRLCWAEVVTAAGVPARSVHSLRHTANSILADRGVPDATRATIMGHATIQTNRIYQHDIGEQSVATAALDTALGV